MPANLKNVESEIKSIEGWVKKISKNEKAVPQELILEASNIREKAFKIYEEMVPVNKQTGEPEDPIVAAFNKVITSNQVEVQKEIIRLVYEGAVDPMGYYEALIEIIKKHSSNAYGLKSFRPTKLADITVKGCTLCYACAACIACVACLASGTVVAGATGAAGAAGVSQA